MRASEIMSLNVSSLNTDDRSLVVATKKRRDYGKNRQLFWTESTDESLTTYLAARKVMTKQDALFVNVSANCKKDRLTVRSMQRILKVYCGAAGLDGGSIKLHSFRHGWVMRAVEAEMYPPYVQAYLGHAHPASTQVYYNVRNKALKAEFHSKVGDNRIINMPKLPTGTISV
jgi:integrase